MLQNYRELLEKLFNGIFTGQSVSLSDYVASLGYTLVLLIAAAALLLLIYGAYKVPRKLYRILIKKPMAPINEAYLAKETPTKEAINAAKATVRRNAKLFAAFLVVYIAIAIPTLLFVINFVLQFF